ncbi:YfhO family protein [Patescibacteria group bacterium]|nr:YfhO family protein [Patescibacteria group bacterium]
MRHIKPLLFLIAFTLLFFRKTFVQGLIPIPFDLLVGWFFPYIVGGWFVPGILTQYKGGNFASDAIREIYPWRELAVNLLKNGELPLWNPYAFSGTPLLANMQSAIFYPVNVIFLLIQNFPFAWAAYIISAVLLSSLFMFLFLKSLKLSVASALFGSIAFAASGYMIVWLEWGVIAHAIIWLPLSLFAIKRWWESKKVRFLVLFVFSASSTIFAGYPQGAAYNLLIVASWFIFLLKTTAKRQRLSITLPVIVSAMFVIGITTVQWVPTAQLYFHSAMRGEVSQSLSREAALPFPHFATVLAPDYFGNRVTDDYWAKSRFSGVDYMDADLYVGAVTLLFAAFALLKKKKTEETKWLSVLLVLGVVLGAKTPIISFIANLGIPVLSTGAAAKALVISIFALCALGAFGFQQMIDHKQPDKRRQAIWIVGGLYTVLFIVSVFLDPTKAVIARKSLIIPGVAFSIGAFLLLKKSPTAARRTVVGSVLIAVLAGELLLHAEKILPFSSPAFAYPKHELIEQLRARSGYERVAGFWDSEIATNFPTAFRLYSTEGYDPLYIRRYGEFMTAAEKGELPDIVPRSDADITQTNETNRNRLIDLTSVKYIPAKVTNPEETWEEEPLKYDPSRFKLVWQEGKFKIYENLHSLPKAKLFYNWRIISEDAEIIQTLYDQQFDPHKIVLLEKDPAIEQTEDAEGKARIVSYKAMSVETETESKKPAILLLTDSYYPGWKATLDGKPAEILRANYTFRAIVVPRGKHIVVFRYEPKGFMLGAKISVVSIFLLMFATVIFKPKRTGRPE